MREDICLKSAFDGTRIAATVVTPDIEAPRAVCQLLHGMAEHRARYLPFMQYLAENGVASIAADMRGHGETAGEENYGYFGEDSVAGVLADIDQVGDVLRERYGNAPFFLLGHSMGSLTARAYAAGHDEKLSGVVLTGVVPYVAGVSVAQCLAGLLSLFRGERYHSALVAHLATGAYNKTFADDGAADEPFLWLSVDPDNRRAFAADPACGFSFTLNGYITLFALMRYAYAPKNWNVRNKKMPWLLLSGEMDPVTGGAKKLRGAARFLTDMGYRRVASGMYPGLRHEILFETERRDVYADVLEFFENTAAEKK